MKPGDCLGGFETEMLDNFRAFAISKTFVLNFGLYICCSGPWCSDPARGENLFEQEFLRFIL